MGVPELLRVSADNTKELLKRELEIKLAETPGKMALYFPGENLL
jgi:hypothetical protein